MKPARAAASPRRLDLCIDDFGLGRERSRSMLELAERGRASSLSCLVNGPQWRECAGWLGAVAGRVGLGLHFNLTEGEPLSAELARRWPRLPALPTLIALAHVRQLPRAAIEAEWRAQLAAFREATGREPDHLDGHQHVHHLPGVREAVLDQAAAAPTAVRNTGRVGGPGFAAKRAAIEHTGGRALARALERRGVRHNARLLGAYDFEAPDYGALMRRWLAEVPTEGALLFCHAARAGAGDAPDAIDAARSREFDYVGGDDFPRDLAAAGVALGPAWL